MNLKTIYYFFGNDLKLEWRQKYALNGIILYIFSTLFIVLTGFAQLNDEEWISLFWIVMMFASLNAGAKSFIQESKGRTLYYYTILSPENLIFARLLYNFFLLLIIGFLSYFGFVLFFNNAPSNISFFFLLIFLGGLGFSSIFTMISAISSKAKGSSTLMTILSFPLVLPQLMLLIKLSKKAFAGLDMNSGLKDIVALSSLNIIVIITTFILFPYLWKEN